MAEEPQNPLENNYNLIKLGENVVLDAAHAIEWCQNNGLLSTQRECRRCRVPMTIRKAHGIGAFRCRRELKYEYCIRKKNVKGCDGPQHSIAENTWFEGIQSVEMVAKGLLLTYSFAVGLSYKLAVRESTLLKTGKITSENTVADWYSYCRSVNLGYGFIWSSCDHALVKLLIPFFLFPLSFLLG